MVEESNTHLINANSLVNIKLYYSNYYTFSLFCLMISSSLFFSIYQQNTNNFDLRNTLCTNERCVLDKLRGGGGSGGGQNGDLNPFDMSHISEIGNKIIVNRYNTIPNDQCVLTTFPDPKDDISDLTSDDRVEFNQNVNDNIFHKNSRADDICHILRDLRVKNHNKIIISNLNINSISNKFDALKTIIPGNIDIFVVTETKLDASFETSQFCMEGFNEPYRLDRNRNGGGILIYIREGIPTRLLNLHTFPYDVEGMFVEINLRKTKWLLYGTYHPPGQDDKYFFDHLGKALDIYSD